jgi:hypothetical protein
MFFQYDNYPLAIFAHPGYSVVNRRASCFGDTSIRCPEVRSWCNVRLFAKEAGKRIFPVKSR